MKLLFFKLWSRGGWNTGGPPWASGPWVWGCTHWACCSGTPRREAGMGTGAPRGASLGLSTHPGPSLDPRLCSSASLPSPLLPSTPSLAQRLPCRPTPGPLAPSPTALPAPQTVWNSLNALTPGLCWVAGGSLLGNSYAKLHYKFPGRLSRRLRGAPLRVQYSISAIFVCIAVSHQKSVLYQHPEPCIPLAPALRCFQSRGWELAFTSAPKSKAAIHPRELPGCPSASGPFI